MVFAKWVVKGRFGNILIGLEMMNQELGLQDTIQLSSRP